MDEVSIERARKTLGEIVDRARIADEHTTITRQGKPGAVVVSSDWYDAVTVLIAELEALEAYRDRMAALRAGRRTAGLALRDKRVVNHIDGDPRNNDPRNLEIRDAPEGES